MLRAIRSCTASALVALATAHGQFLDIGGNFAMPGNPPDATYLIAGIDFNGVDYDLGFSDFDGNPLGSKPGWYSDTTLIGDALGHPDFRPRGVLYVNGQKGASVWIEDAFAEVPGSVGGRVTTDPQINLTISTSRRQIAAPTNPVQFQTQLGSFNDPQSGQNLANRSVGFMVGGGATDFALVFDTRGYTGQFTLSYAGSANPVPVGTPAQVAVEWLYSVDGGATKTPLGITHTFISEATTRAVITVPVELSSVVQDREEVIFIGRVAGLNGTATYFNLDNVQLVSRGPVVGTSGIAPTLSGNPPDGAFGVAYSHSFTLTGAPAPTLSVTAGALPAGLSLTATGLSGTPSQSGRFTGTITATNDSGTADLAFGFDITRAPSLANAGSGPPPAGDVGGSYGPYSFDVGGFPVPSLTVLGGSGALPPGLTLSGTALTGVPTAGGAFNFVVRATSTAGQADLPVTVTIRQAPSLVAPASSVARAGVASSFVFTAGGFPAPTLSLTGSLPPGFAFTASSATIGGTANQVGFFPVTLRAESSAGSATLPFTITVEDVPGILLASGTTYDATAGVAFTAAFNVRSVPLGSIEVTGLPAWLSASVVSNPDTGLSSVTLSGTPPNEDAEINLQATAANSVGPALPVGFTVRVRSVVVEEPPAFTTQPASGTFVTGETVTLQAFATGTPSPSYQWYKAGVAIPGATSPSLVIANIQPADEGDYTVIASNTVEGTPRSVESDIARVTVLVPVAITTQPAGGVFEVGQRLEITVGATGSGPLAYVWTRNGTELPVNGPAVVVEAATVDDSGTYVVVVTNTVNSVTSAAAEVVVGARPVFSRQPTGTRVVAGATVRLEAEATSVSPVTYRWTRDGVDVPGAADRVLELVNAHPEQSGTYICIATNAQGPASSAPAQVTIVPFVPVTITSQPSSVVAIVGDTVTFRVEASGGEDLAIQWFRGDAEIAGAIAPELTLSSAGQADAAGVYRAVITNSQGGFVRSADAYLILLSSSSSAIPLSGGEGQFDVFASPSASDWSVSGAPGWIALSIARNPTTGGGTVRFVAADSTEARTAALAVTRGSVSAMHTVTQDEIPVLVDAFSGPIDPAGATGTWSPTGSIVPLFLPTVGGRQDVLAAGAVTGPEGAQIRTRLPLPASTSGLKISVAARVEAATLAGRTALVGTGLADGTGPLVEFGLRAQAGSLVPYARFKDSGGVFRQLDGDLVVLRDEPVNRWVPMEVEVSPSGTITFWMDGVRLWAPVQTVGSVADVRATATISDDAVAKTYLQGLEVFAGFLPRQGVARLENISARLEVGRDDEVAIAGVVFSPGATARPILVRGVGPALVPFGLGGVLQRPQLVVYDDEERSNILRIQNEWEGHRFLATIQQIRDLAARVGAFPLANGAADSAWIYTGEGGRRMRTVVMRGIDGGTGTGLLELYRDGDAVTSVEVTNFSTRGVVSPESVAIVGFVVGGDASATLLLRGVGPGLASFGVTNFATQPRMDVYSGSKRVRSASAWGTDARPSRLASVASSVGAFSLQTGTADTALLVHVQPGVYTAVIAVPAGSPRGVVLAEIYLVPDSLGAATAIP